MELTIFKNIGLLIGSLFALYLISLVFIGPFLGNLYFKIKMNRVEKWMYQWYGSSATLISKNKEGITFQIKINYSVVINIFPYNDHYKLTVTNDLQSDSYVFDYAYGWNLHKVLEKYVK